jgi:hypothetical protein
MQCLARVLAFVGLCASVTVARAATIEEFNVMGWIVGAYSDNRTGQFTHCATSIPYRSGTTLFFHLGRNYMWSMGLHNPQWRSTPGALIDLIYYIDTGPQTRARAQVNNLGLVTIPLADSRALFDAFKRGRRLFVADSKERFGFDLANSSKALNAVYECVQRHSSGQSPPGPGPAPPPPPRNSPPDATRGGSGSSL